MIKGNNVSYIKVIGLKIQNYTGGGIHFEAFTSYQGGHIEIRNNELHNNTYVSGYGHAILVTPGGPHMEGQHADGRISSLMAIMRMI